MTLASAVLPLATFAVAFQTLIYAALPHRHRTLWAPMFTGIVGAALTLGAAGIFGFRAIGLSISGWEIALLWGVLAVAGTALVGLALFLRDRTRAQLADPRLARLSRWQAFVQIFVRIPVVTALIEEAFFRGVLHSALAALYPPSMALWLGAGLFGMWHIGPGFDQAQASDRSTTESAVHTAITVVVTTLAGAFLVWLRMETGSIWAPFAVHAGLNMTMAAFSRRAARNTTSVAATE